MNRFTIAVGAGAVAAVLAGCGPKLAQVPYGEEEARWQKILRDNYSGYEAPVTAPPAIRDNVSPRLLEEEQARKNGENTFAPPPPADNPPIADNPAVADDPALMVDRAAERPAVAEPVPAREPKKKAAPAKKKSAKPAKKKPAAKGGARKNSTVYEVKPDDTLSDIALKFYGDARRQDVIIQVNPDLKKNPDLLKAGMKLVIPKI